MNPIVKSALLSLFTLTASQTHAQETTSLAFTVNACSGDNETITFDVRTSLELMPDNNGLDDLLIDATSDYMHQIIEGIKPLTAQITSNSTRDVKNEIFEEFFSNQFPDMNTHYAQAIRDILPDTHKLNDIQIITSDIVKDPTRLCI